MARRYYRFFAVLLVAVTLVCNTAVADTNTAVAIPEPTYDAPLAEAKGVRTAVLAGGCFWGVEAVFEHVKGVKSVTSGYAGGSARDADYESVSAGETGHAESVRITYDPSQVTYGRLLQVFFSVAHDPTQVNRQGPDVGKHYRSAIFYVGEEQKSIAESYIVQLNQAKLFQRPIATQVTPLKKFHEAEAYHQDYAARHPDQPYIVIHDLPKVENLRKRLPELYAVK